MNMDTCKYSKDNGCYANVRAILARSGMGPLKIPLCPYTLDDVRIDFKGWYVKNGKKMCHTFKPAEGLEKLLVNVKSMCRECGSSLEEKT